MKKQAIIVTLRALSFLVLFRIGLSQSMEDGFLPSLPPNPYIDEYIYKEDNSNEDKTLFDMNTQRIQYSHENDSNTDVLNTEDANTEENIYKINCKKFNTWLNFSDTSIKRLGKKFFNSPFVICLNFEGNQIESVESGAFDNLPALEYLNLAGNSISSVFSFNGHNNLKTLILANQSIYYVRQLEVFGKYPELRYLDLSGNKISSIKLPDNYPYFHNYLNEKPVFPRLRYLDLSNNNLNTFQDNFLFDSNITNLYLMNSDLYSVDLRNFFNLVELRLENNYLKRISEYCNYENICIDEMPRLKYLSLSKNRIDYIDENIFTKMQELVTLDLSNNKLEGTFIIQKHKLVSLKNLYLDNNRLFLITMINRLPNLSILSVAYNKLQKIDFNFVNAPNLKKLYLNNNEINDIYEDTFSKLELLEELYLNNNNLDTLPNEWCQNLRNLRYLNVSGNPFKTIESLSLSQSIPIIKIDFLNNQLTHMKIEVLQNLPKNATIYFFPQSENNALSKRSYPLVP